MLFERTRRSLMQAPCTPLSRPPLSYRRQSCRADWTLQRALRLIEVFPTKQYLVRMLCSMCKNQTSF